MRWLLVTLGIGTAVYTAFLFAQAKGRDLWQSPLLPMHMLTHGAVTGGGVLLLLAALTGMAKFGVLSQALAGVLLLNLALLAVEFTLPHVSHDTRAALRILSHGALRMPFWAAVLLGNALPAALLLAGMAWATPVAALLMLSFAVVFNHIWVRAPQLIPLR